MNTERQRPLVSVIIPAYNAGAFIGKALLSLQSQTFTNWDAIIVDDNSLDNTYEVACGFANNDKRIKVYRNQSNIGAGASRNVAIAAADGDWIAILDADDMFLPTRLETLLDHGERNRLDIVADNLLLRDPFHGQVVRTGLPQDGRVRPFTLDELLKKDLPASGFAYGLLKPLVRISFMNVYDIKYRDFRFAQDFIFYAELLLAGARGEILSAPLYDYTLPISEIAPTKSTKTRTPMKTHILLEGSRFIRCNYANSLTRSQILALDHRDSYIKHRDAALAFKESYLRRHYKECAFILFNNLFIIKYIARGFLWRTRAIVRKWQKLQ